ncbi:MAG: shikimate 5-dehydrogenase [Ruminococcaceae bacterium]|nr:shikimate 5-dehydrogenase [Oscillospiraceae bacterium]
MKYGLIGEKLGHSFSKVVHSKITDYDYDLFEIARPDLDAFMQKRDFCGINVTIPYKEAVIPYLDEISAEAKSIGAVNTIVNKNGKLYGYNTDFYGLKGLIEYNNIEIKNKIVLILGSGGTSKTANAVCKSLGAKEIFIASRKDGEGFVTYTEALKLKPEIIINTTPCGMYPNNSDTPINLENFSSIEAVVDVVYNPLKTRLVLDAHKKGIKAVGGLYMLYMQAVKAAEIFLEKEITTNAFNEIFKDKQSLVLIGMPSCGKTTLGKLLSKELGKTFVDTDDEIVKAANMPIPEIFEKFGEEYFRDLEAKVVAELSTKQGLVIATGGGVILRRENVEALKQNGSIIFIDRPLDLLITTDDRPLSSSRELLEKRYYERYATYCLSCDVRINADSDTNTNLKRIKEGFLNENFGN